MIRHWQTMEIQIMTHEVYGNLTLHTHKLVMEQNLNFTR